MFHKENYSQQYNFHVSHLSLGDDKMSISDQSHGPLTTSDILGAQPRKFTSRRTLDRDYMNLDEYENFRSSEGRSIFRAPAHPRNPLDPQYDLPPVFVPPVEETKFVRDTLDTSDIPGARPREPRKFIERSSCTLTKSLEEKCTSKTGGGAVLPRDNLDVTDINLKNKPKRQVTSENIGKQTSWLDNVGQHNSIQGKFERYAALREINKRARTAIDESLLLICSFETKLNVSFIKTFERECRGLDRDGSGILKVKELVEAIDRSIPIKLSQAEASNLLHTLTVGSPSGFVEYKNILAELYTMYEQDIECNPPESKGLEMPAWYSSRQRRKKDVVSCVIQMTK